jgi:phosphoribosylanthranilate isomerase
MRPRILVSAIADVVEAWMAIARGASLLGMATDPLQDAIDLDDIAAIAASAPPGVATVLHTDATDPAQLAQLQRDTGVTALQLSQPLAYESYSRLRDTLPGIKLLQDVVVSSRDAVDTALTLSRHVDCLVLHTDEDHWQLCASIADDAACPIILAGLPESASFRRMLATVQPYGIDTGVAVRSSDRLDESKLRTFMDTLAD